MARLGGESLYHIKQGMLAPVTLSSLKQIVYCKLPRHFDFVRLTDCLKVHHHLGAKMHDSCKNR